VISQLFGAENLSQLELHYFHITLFTHHNKVYDIVAVLALV